MICYKDMTFCASPNCTGKCGRQLTPEIEAAAEKSGLEISLGDFCTPDVVVADASPVKGKP